MRRCARSSAALPPARTLDVACGTGYLTQHLRGTVTGLDPSESMVEIASRADPGRRASWSATRLPLPFADGAFERVFTGHFYGHLEAGEREASSPRRGGWRASSWSPTPRVRPDHEIEEWQERVLNDGSRHEVYKRYFTGEGLAEELGGGEVLHAGPWFVVVRRLEVAAVPPDHGVGRVGVAGASGPGR